MTLTQQIAQLKAELDSLAACAAHERELRTRAEQREKRLLDMHHKASPGNPEDKLRDARSTLKKLAKDSDCTMSRYWAERCLNRIGFQ